MDWTWYLFGFKGRINRAKYWLAGLVIVCLDDLLCGWLTACTSRHRLARQANSRSDFDIDDIFRLARSGGLARHRARRLPTLLIKAIGTALFLWIYLATSIKRLHDRDRSGWWIVPFFFIPGLYKQFADRLPDSYLVLIRWL